MLVEVTVADKAIRFLFGNRQISKDHEDLDVYSQHLPLGVAIHGLKTGQTVTYTVPNGKAMLVTINSVHLYLSLHLEMERYWRAASREKLRPCPSERPITNEIGRRQLCLIRDTV